CYDAFERMLHSHESAARGRMLKKTPGNRVMAALVVRRPSGIHPVFGGHNPGSSRAMSNNKGETYEEDVYGSMRCVPGVPGVDYRTGTGGNKRSVEVRQTF